MTPSYTVKKTDDNIMQVHMNVDKAGWEQLFLLRSDVHHDNPDCDQKAEKRDLQEALNKGAGIADVGDCFCAMQGKYDKRSDKSKLRPEHQNSDYLDSLVTTAADFYEPYAENWLNFGYGNHETAILNHHETDLTKRLVTTLNDRKGTNIQALGYTGWIWFMFYAGGQRHRQMLWYTHGYGGGGPVTQDMIQASRQLVYVENADIMMSGHVHRSWVMEYVKIRVNQHGIEEKRPGYYIKIPTMKDEYKKGVKGFSVERGHGPRPTGSYWLQFRYDNKQIKTRVFKAN